MIQFIDRLWYQQSKIAWLLLPFSFLFYLVVQCRRFAFRNHWLPSKSVSIPVVVVGNLTAGGAGKTPMILALIELLQRHGYRPGVVSRGYGGSYSSDFVWLHDEHLPDEVGDEPAMIYARTNVPVVVAKSRYEAAYQLEKSNLVDIILADDGLQHYPLQRDIELLMVDNTKRFGNTLLMPAGPLREPLSRLKDVDFIVSNGAAQSESEYSMNLAYQNILSLTSMMPVNFDKTKPVVALAGIGNPRRFHDTLVAQQFQVVEFYEFADHKKFKEEDLRKIVQQGHPVLMTEKDAVKCQHFSEDLKKSLFYMRVTAVLEPYFEQHFMNKLRTITHGV